MLPGNLVELSVYGRGLKIFKDLRDKVGLIEVAEPDHYEVRWHGEAGRGWPATKHRRMDLRKVK